MRGDGVPTAPGMLDSEAVAGILKAEGAILGLFQETGLQDPQGMVHMENQWRHHQALEVSHPGVSKSFLGHGKMGKMGKMGKNGGKWGKTGKNGGKRGKTGGKWGEMRGYGMPEHACSPLLLL